MLCTDNLKDTPITQPLQMVVNTSSYIKTGRLETVILILPAINNISEDLKNFAKYSTPTTLSNNWNSR